jgi:flagellar biosynthetic protein FliP
LVQALAGASQSVAENTNLRPALQTGVTFGAIVLVPIVLLMTTGYIRMAVVLGLVRQGFGAASAPPPQVTTALAIFLTILVMLPVWQQIKRDAVDPYLSSENPLPLPTAMERGIEPLKRFMSQQLIAAGNTQDVWLFLKYLPEEQRQTTPRTFSEVPLQVLVPAFMVSELKVAFAIGFQIFLPFLLIDLLVSSVITSLGMTTLSPNVVSLPLKLALFVMVDGWNLIVGMLLRSFAAMTI